MAFVDHHTITVAVRWVHVAAMAIILGGALVPWLLARRDGEGALAAAVAYEWLFWGAAGAIVLTGVGNLGAFAPALPGPNTRWSITLAWKLAAVVALLMLSLFRALVVVQLRDGGAPRAGNGVLARAYGATAVVAAAVVALAEVLAHG